MKQPASVLFLGKKNDADSLEALAFTQANFGPVTHALGGWGEPFNEDFYNGRFDIVVSYLSRWVVPEVVLRKASVAINFHPASPDYPGIGCNNFALYDGAKEYGVTCHFMAPKVDTGEIIATKRFPILPSDDVASLIKRTYAFQKVLFFEVMSKLALGETLKPNGETWTRKPYSRKEFAELCKIDLTMNEAEIAKRVRATHYPPWGPSIQVGAFTFQLKNQ